MKELRLQNCLLDERYNIIECLGRGSYSEIFLAKDLRAGNDTLHQFVVIKAMNIQLQGDVDTELERTLIENFQNEAIALDRVRHPNVINRLGHGTAIDLSGTMFHYLILEYLPGGDIFKLCRNHAMPLKHTLFYLEQVCAGLSYAHERGVIHRDIKPQNLLLTKDKRTVKIADFGVAKIGAFEGSITRVGTNIYAAPEHNPQLNSGQLVSPEMNQSTRKLTPAADIYSLGKTVYVMLTGESPRRFASHSITDFPSPFSNQIWSKEMLKVLQKATEHNPTERHKSVLDFWDHVSNAVSTANLTNINQNEDTQSLSYDKTTFEQEAKQLAQSKPEKPKFDTTRNLQNIPAIKEAERPRIVVQFNDNASTYQSPVRQNERTARDVINAMPDIVDERRNIPQQKKSSALGEAFKKFLVGVSILLVFTSMLLATHYFFRGRPIWSSEQTQTTNELIGKEGKTTTDVNLRPDPSLNRSPVGLAEKGSIIKVINVEDDWCQVQVLKHGRPKRDPNSLDQGWILKKYIDFD